MSEKSSGYNEPGGFVCRLAEEGTNEVEDMAMYRPRGGIRESKSKQAPDRSRSETHRLGIFLQYQTNGKTRNKQMEMADDDDDV